MAVSRQVLEQRVDGAVAKGLLTRGAALRVRLLAQLMEGAPVSGESLAAELHVSRAAVNKHVGVLRAKGFGIHGDPGVGYALSALPVELPEELVAALLLGEQPAFGPETAGPVGLPYYYLREVESTNDAARVMAEQGAPHGTTVLAERQTMGRGRLARRWHSEPLKDLTYSVLLRPTVEPARMGLLVLAVATSVAHTLSQELDLGRRVGVKWPIDVLVDRRKVCGILLEASVDMDRVHWVVVGIGLNVNGASSEVLSHSEPAPGREPPISLSEAVGCTIPRAPLLTRLLLDMGRSIQALERDPAAVLEDFEQLDALRGREIMVRLGTAARECARGRAAGIGNDGSLLLSCDDGLVKTFAAGEVTVLGGNAV